MSENKLTTPGDNTKISGVRVDESSTTDAMSNTGGSTNLNFEIKMTSVSRRKELYMTEIFHTQLWRENWKLGRIGKRMAGNN